MKILETLVRYILKRGITLNKKLSKGRSIDSFLAKKQACRCGWRGYGYEKEKCPKCGSDSLVNYFWNKGWGNEEL